MLPNQNILKCDECGLDLSLIFSRYFIHGLLLCAFCNAHFNENEYMKMTRESDKK